MITLEQIQQAEKEIKTGADFPAFAKKLKEIGVVRNDVFVMNGLSTYYAGDNDEPIQSGPAYEDLLIETETNVADFQEALKQHQQELIDYQTFCRQSANAGVEKWVVDLKAMTVTYFDTAGNEVLVEPIPE